MLALVNLQFLLLLLCAFAIAGTMSSAIDLKLIDNINNDSNNNNDDNNITLPRHERFPEEEYIRTRRAAAPGEEGTTEYVRSLMRNYNRQSTPNPDRGTEVKLGIYVITFHSISEQTMDYSISMYLRQAWTDPRLDYSSAHPNVKSIRMPNMWNEIWLPDTFIRNEKSSNFHSMTVDNRLLKLKPGGDIWYVIKVSGILSCPMKLQSFPMDVQRCPMLFESFGYTMDSLYFNTLPQSIEVDDGLQMPHFSLIGTSISDCSQNYTTGAYPCLEFQFILKRDIGYFITQVYFPSVLIVILSWITFWINVEASAARVTVGLFSMLTITMMSNEARASLPKVSYIKAIDVWMLVCLLFVFLSLIEFAVINLLTGQLQTGKSSQSSAQQSSDEGKERAHKVDKLSRIIFPAAFAVFFIVYWISYTTGG